MTLKRGGTACFFACGCIVLACSCAARHQQFYRDSFYPQDHIYLNETLGFALVFNAAWVVQTDPRDMDKAQRAAARALRAQGAELAFAGSSADGSQGTRAIIENLNRGNEEYLAGVRAANRAGIAEDFGATTIMTGSRLALRWEYRYAAYRYAEYLFTVGTHNVRVAFWTVAERYEDFLPVYDDIMSTLSTRAVN